MKSRAFIAADIEPNEALRDILTDLRRAGAGLKVVRPEILHVTLKFLGDTDEALIDQIASNMERAVVDVHPFTVQLVGMGAFPSLSNIRVVWIGMEDGGSVVRDRTKARLLPQRTGIPEGPEGVQGTPDHREGKGHGKDGGAP